MKKPKFVLSRKNQKGQVAIFVALIFQVIFVFFALLINVGLLVHHKINLQQSTDLAAYYGAMKQAESLNAIAHINYQIKQAWKLLTWRYRVLGTFGFEEGQNQAPASGNTFPSFPIQLRGSSTGRYNSDADNPSKKCTLDSEQLGITDLPFFCVGHNGMVGWPGTAENNCRINCNQLKQGASSISSIHKVGSETVGGRLDYAGRANVFIDAANEQLQQQCNNLGPTGMNILGRFLLNYYIEAKARSETLLMLAANTSQPDAEKIVDLDGNLVLDGVRKTLKNNLTEANASSITDAKIKIVNGLSEKDCPMATDPQNAGNKNLEGQFLKRIEFEVVQFFIHKCSVAPNGSRNDFRYSPGSIFDGDMTNDLKVNADLKNVIMAMVSNPNEKFTVGYEKNPWCQSYYAVKAETEPKIPFLPLSKIKLTAISTAKPFGGSIGPWFGKEWKAGAKTSQDGVGVDQNKQTDPALPAIVKPLTTAMKENVRVLMNFGRSVGDRKGLSDGVYISGYHGLLIDRKPNAPGIAGFGSNNKATDGLGTGRLDSTNGKWPSFKSWDDTVIDMGSPNYDPLTKETGNSDSNLRDIEISAIAPNQFDLAYYSIDPDFYNNYYTRLSNPAIFSKIKSAAGIGPAEIKSVRPDFGNNDKVYTQKKSFGVRNQIEIVEKVFNQSIATNITDFPSGKFTANYPELATRQSSLLTGWTFANFSDFNKFPDADVTTPDGSMSFGRCKDSDWHGNDSNPKYDTPVEFNSALPPTPGNCVTGGRVGYSVKLVSPSMLRSNAPPQPLGGPNTSGQIKNPIPEDFFNF